MALEADYIVLTDEDFLLFPNQEKTLSFQFDMGFHDSDKRGKAPILAFMVTPLPFVNNPISFEVDVNDGVVMHHTFGPDELGDRRGMWEVISFKNLKQGVENTIQFRVETGFAGSVLFSDVILWYHKP